MSNLPFQFTSAKFENPPWWSLQELSWNFSPPGSLVARATSNKRKKLRMCKANLDATMAVAISHCETQHLYNFLHVLQDTKNVLQEKACSGRLWNFPTSKLQTTKRKTNVSFPPSETSLWTQNLQKEVQAGPVAWQPANTHLPSSSFCHLT